MTLIGMISGVIAIAAGATTLLFIAATICGWSRFSGMERWAGIVLTCSAAALTATAIMFPVFLI